MHNSLVWNQKLQNKFKLYEKSFSPTHFTESDPESTISVQGLALVAGISPSCNARLVHSLVLQKHSPAPAKRPSRPARLSLYEGASWVQTWEVRFARLILPLTHPRHCNGTGLLRLKIAHNQSTGRHISVLLKRINEQCRGRINGWQDSESIDTDMLFGITSSCHRPVLVSCASVRWTSRH